MTLTDKQFRLIATDLPHDVWQKIANHGDDRAQEIAEHIITAYLKTDAPDIPEPPEGYHLATEAELDCLPAKPMIWTKRGDTKWRESGHQKGEAVSTVFRNKLWYALPNNPSLATFTNGQIDPPSHGQWHRNDWTPEMLPDGWRPLLAQEMDGKQYSDLVWSRSGSSFLLNNPCGWFAEGNGWFRTKRPLPAAPPEPEYIPLGPEDVPPGSAIRPDIHDQRCWNLVESVTMTGVIVSWWGGDDRPSLRHFTFGQLFGGGVILRPGTTEWQPCRKVKP